MFLQDGVHVRAGATYILWIALAYVLARAGSAVFIYLQVEPGPAMPGWNRIANVWSLPRTAHESSLRTFAARAAEDHRRSRREGAILVAGDSQLYGYFLPAQKTAASFLRDELPGMSVYNASKLNGTYSWTRLAMANVLDEGLAPRALVLNVNPAIQGGAPEGRGLPLVSRHLLAALLETRETLGMVHDTFQSAVRSEVLPFDPYDLRAVPPGDGTYQLIALKKDYYPSKLPAQVAQSLRALLEFSRGTVELVVVLASPHYYAPYNEAPYRYGWDTGPVVREAMAICSEYAHAACLDLSTAFGRELFHDVVHLNEAGHRRLAAEVAAVIRSRLREPGPVSR